MKRKGVVTTRQSKTSPTEWEGTLDLYDGAEWVGSAELKRQPSPEKVRSEFRRMVDLNEHIFGKVGIDGGEDAQRGT